MTNQEIIVLKEEFRNLFWDYHFRRNTKLEDKQNIKRLGELQKIFEKENITVV